MLYKECRGDRKAARPSKGGPTEVGGLSALNLPLVSIPHPTRMPDGPAKRLGGRSVCWYQYNFEYMLNSKISYELHFLQFVLGFVAVKEQFRSFVIQLKDS